jgi:hypothetical protein
MPPRSARRRQASRRAGDDPDQGAGQPAPGWDRKTGSPNRGRGGARSKRAREGAKCRFTFANTTSWSAKAESWLLQVESEVIGAAETHWPLTGWRGPAARVAEAGFASAVALPQQSVDHDSGNYGGVFVAAKSGFAAIPPGCEPWDARGRCWVSPLRQLALLQVPLVGSSVIFAASYHRGGIDADLLRQLCSATRQGAVPFILAGDFNDSPDVMQASMWPELLRCVVIVPESPTCWATPTGSSLDYFLVSAEIAHLVLDVLTLTEVSFGPHSAIQITLSRGRPGPRCGYRVPPAPSR